MLRSPAAAVSDPSSFSNAQKKSVLLGWPSRSTAMLPAKLRGSVQVTFGNASVTSKSVAGVSAWGVCAFARGARGRTALPVGAEVAVGLAGVVVGPAAGRGRELGAGAVGEERKGRKREERSEERRPAHFEGSWECRPGAGLL